MKPRSTYKLLLSYFSVRRIPVFNGKGRARRLTAYAIVDDGDYALVSKFNWVQKTVKKDGLRYAVTNKKDRGRKRVRPMHRIILKAKKGEMIDHQDGNGMNNRRSNIRRANNAQNQFNRRKCRGRSRYKGVSWENARKSWRASIVKSGVSHRLGNFKYQKDAALAYDIAAQLLFGEYARLNFPRANS